MKDVLDLEKYPNITLRYQPWNNSYSAARNFAMLFIRPKAKWIGYLDCDERIVHPEIIPHILDNLPNEVGAAIIPILSPHHFPEGTRMVEGTNIRFFRAWHQYYFIHDVHEQIGAAIKVSGKHTVTIDKKDSYIAHLGYDLSPEEMLVKTMKYRDMLNADKKKYPRDGAVYYHSAKNYSTMNIDALAVNDYMMAINMLNTSHSIKAECYGALAGYANKQNEFDQAISYAVKGLEENPESFLSNFNLAYSYYRLRRFQEAYDVLSKAKLENRADANKAKQMLNQLRGILNEQANAPAQLGNSETERPTDAGRVNPTGETNGEPIPDRYRLARRCWDILGKNEKSNPDGRTAWRDSPIS